MANHSIELHDSSVIAIRIDDSEVVLELDAYLHTSEGRPGIDAGVGSIQRAQLVFNEGRLLERTHGPSLWIMDGALRSKSLVLDNLLPVPFELSEDVEVLLGGAEGRLHLCGAGVRLVLIGEPRFVEKFPGSNVD